MSQTYRVTFDKDRGIGGSAGTTVALGERPASVSVPERPGHLFGGYWSDADGDGCQYFAADGSAVRPWDIPRDTVLTAKWMVRFGTGCSNVTVSSFRPICSFGELNGTTPRTFSVPPLSFPVPVPPNECACLAFETSGSSISMTDDDNPSLAFSITQKDPNDCCKGTYLVTPKIRIPKCALTDDPDTKEWGRLDLDKGGSQIMYRLRRTDCTYTLEMKGAVVHPGSSVPCYTTLSNSFNIPFKLTGFDGTERSPQNIPVTISSEKHQKDDCPEYSFSSTGLSLNLSLGAGGDVFADSSDDLLLDGAEYGATKWYGGGYGDSGSGFAAGPNRRNANVIRGADVFGRYDVPAMAITSRLATANSVTNSKWESSRRPNEHDPSAATGDLDIVAPAGVQWCDYGMALSLSRYTYSACGLLSSLQEEGIGVIVSPAPAAYWRGTPYSTSGTTTNASGLSIPAVEAIETFGTGYPGLSVDTGLGLRLHGIERLATGETRDITDTLNGKVELQLGRGLAFGRVTGSTTEYTNGINDKDGAVTVALGPGLAFKSATTATETNNYTEGTNTSKGAVSLMLCRKDKQSGGSLQTGEKTWKILVVDSEASSSSSYDIRVHYAALTIDKYGRAVVTEERPAGYAGDRVLFADPWVS